MAIDALGPDGDGTEQRPANALQRKVDQVSKLEQGQDQAAAEVLAGFIQQVENLEAAQVLSAGQAVDLRATEGIKENAGADVDPARSGRRDA